MTHNWMLLDLQDLVTGQRALLGKHGPRYGDFTRVKDLQKTAWTRGVG